MKKYKHLTREERDLIAINNAKGLSNRKIALKLRRDRRTIDRELKRNTKYFQQYLPSRAERRAKRVAKRQRQVAALKSPLIFVYVREKLRMGWSPESSAGRLRIDQPQCSIHVETIYRYVYDKRNRKDRLWEHLPLGRKKRRVKVHGRGVKRKGRIPGAVSIELRPKVVERRKQYGHWETDNMEGPRGSRVVLSATVERKTRYMVLSKLRDQTASVKAASVVEGLLPYTVRTLTADNGKENSRHVEISQKLKAEMYFCHAYASWEKGSVENAIKRVRRYIPKGTDLRDVSKEHITLIEKELNSRPMKCLGWLSPSEKMEENYSS
jgi:IS30 family transposase